MITGCDMLKRFDLDLKLKVTEPFEGQKFEILSSLLQDRKLKMTAKRSIGQCTIISVAWKALS